MKQTVDMMYIDDATIAKLLGKMSSGEHPVMNEMMHNINWVLGNEPEMILGGKISPCDVVAESILELPFIYNNLECIIVEISHAERYHEDSPETLQKIDKKTSIYLGFVFICGKKIVMSQLSCYEFIDWINDQKISGTVSKIYIASSGAGAAHIKILLC